MASVTWRWPNSAAMEHWLLVGPRGSRRIAGLQEALQERGSEPARTLDYETLLMGPEWLSEAIAQIPGAIVKLESPGESLALHDRLVRRGWEATGCKGDVPAPALTGELANQHYWFAGFSDVLRALPTGLRYLNSPVELLRMADKLVCQQHLLGTGATIPPLFGSISGYEEMRDRLRHEGCSRAFIKARFGSSGAGVLAYAYNGSGRELLYGSAELVVQEGRSRVFNSLRQRRYDRHAEIVGLVNLIAAQGAYLERWVPKPSVPGNDSYRYDVRMIALDGVPRQRVARASRGMLTNLHLGNQRLALESLLDQESMTGLESATATAAAAFPRSRMIGFDLIVRGARSWILEANGFGDLLPGLRYRGRTTYEDQAALSAGQNDELEERFYA